MTEPEATATEPQQSTTTEPAETKPTETVDFWKAKAREQEKRAKDNADAVKRLAEIEDAQKSEAQKAADRISELEKQASAAQRDALRFKVASKYGIGDEDADLLLTGSDEETLQKQAKALAARVEERKKQGNHVASEGKSAGATSSTADQFAEFFTNQIGG